MLVSTRENYDAVGMLCQGCSFAQKSAGSGISLRGDTGGQGFRAPEDALLPKFEDSNSDFGMCMDTCLDSNYGSMYDTAASLSPLSYVSAGFNAASELIEDRLSATANRNLYGNRHQFNAGQRQLRTLTQFRSINAASLVVGMGALGFQAGALEYCAVECL